MFKKFAIFKISIISIFLLLNPSFLSSQPIPFDFDKEFRLPLWGIVIHHTGTSGNITVESLSNIHKWRIYKPVFEAMKNIVGEKIYSNHFYREKETFCAYHWLVYPDGRKIKVLKDIIKINGEWYVEHVGWQAGTWEVNGKTLAIAVVGNYQNSIPPKPALKAISDIIVSYQKKTGLKLEIVGHREVRQTTCPGNKFLGRKGWKSILIKMIKEKMR